MTKINITKEFRFEAAHALLGYDGPCRNVHGHSYELSVTITGEPISDQGSPKLGMVMDFGDLKKIIKKNIIDPLDHALILSSAIPEADKRQLSSMFDNLVIVDFQPTSENLLVDFAQKIKKLLPVKVRLHSLKLRETANSFAEWFNEDPD
jgi:6-pyruvoyltetrahydropterin/6-carboxytetrahydropterin synthase